MVDIAAQRNQNNAVGAITFPPLIIALLFYYRAPKKELIIFYSILSIGVIVFLIFTGNAW